jgi:hypothetical protein
MSRRHRESPKRGLDPADTPVRPSDAFLQNDGEAGGPDGEPAGDPNVPIRDPGDLRGDCGKGGDDRK